MFNLSETSSFSSVQQECDSHSAFFGVFGEYTKVHANIAGSWKVALRDSLPHSILPAHYLLKTPIRDCLLSHKSSPGNLSLSKILNPKYNNSRGIALRTFVCLYCPPGALSTLPTALPSTPGTLAVSLASIPDSALSSQVRWYDRLAS